MTYTATHTATSIHRSLEVHVDDELVYALNGALLGDVDGMTRLGWEITPAAPTVTVAGILTGPVEEVSAAVGPGTYPAEYAHPVTGRWRGELVVVSETFAHFAPLERVAA